MSILAYEHHCKAEIDGKVCNSKWTSSMQHTVCPVCGCKGNGIRYKSNLY